MNSTSIELESLGSLDAFFEIPHPSCKTAGIAGREKKRALLRGTERTYAGGPFPVREQEVSVSHAPASSLARSLSLPLPAAPEMQVPLPTESTEASDENQMEDSALVAAAQKGNTSAFDSLVLRHSPKLYGLVFHMTSSHEDTDDLLQDIWSKVYRSLSSFRGASRFTTWLHSIAVHMTLNFLKRRNKRTTLSLDAGSSSHSGDNPEGSIGGSALSEEGLVHHHTPRSETHLSELQERLTQALDQLSPEHRAVVSMFDIQGMAHAEIARIMGVSEGTVRSRLFYAHRQLQSLLSDLAVEFFPSLSAAATPSTP